MFSIQKMLGKEDRLFGLLEASAEEARLSVHALVKLTKTLADEPAVLDEFLRLREIDKKLTQEINNIVYRTFITALDREDIDKLSAALYKIPKMVHKFTERLSVSPPTVLKIDFSEQIRLLEQTTNVVCELVCSLRNEGLNQIRELNERL